MRRCGLQALSYREALNAAAFTHLCGIALQQQLDVCVFAGRSARRSTRQVRARIWDTLHVLQGHEQSVGLAQKMKLQAGRAGELKL
jgi:hypothetical protein